MKEVKRVREQGALGPREKASDWSLNKVRVKISGIWAEPGVGREAQRATARSVAPEDLGGR